MEVGLLMVEEHSQAKTQLRWIEVQTTMQDMSLSLWLLLASATECAFSFLMLSDFQIHLAFTLIHMGLSKKGYAMKILKTLCKRTSASDLEV